MRLIIREYLGLLKESGQFDALIPDLLQAMGLTPLGKPQIGTRQSGVDIAAVGPHEDVQTLWLFVLKQGDIGRRDWDSGPNAVRQSLEEIKDVYLQTRVPEEHASLPVRIVVATTGEFRQDIEQNLTGYERTNTLPNRSYSRWNGDRVAALIEEYLLDEFALPGEGRSLLRRALSLVGEPEYDLNHFHALLRSLLGWADTSRDDFTMKEARKSLRTIGLALVILVRWSEQEANMRSGFLACERTILWVWNAIRARNLTSNGEILKAYGHILTIYLDAGTKYFNTVQTHLHTRNAIATYYPESALLRERVFEELGIIASIGLSNYIWAVQTQNDELKAGVGFIAESLVAFLESHPATAQPCYDRHSTEIALCLLFLMFTEREDAAKRWLGDLAGRLTFSFRLGRWFPIATDSFDDLVTFEVNPADADVTSLKEMSWTLPVVLQWMAGLGLDDVYSQLVALKSDVCKDTCCQLWYPDETSEQHRYASPAHQVSGFTEAPIRLPDTPEEMREHMRRVLTSSPISVIGRSSAAEAGLPWLDFVACRHFRTPLDPRNWQIMVMPEVPHQGAT